MTTVVANRRAEIRMRFRGRRLGWTLRQHWGLSASLRLFGVSALRATRAQPGAAAAVVAGLASRSRTPLGAEAESVAEDAEVFSRSYFEL